MRLDKFLKVSRIIKRRSVANEACSLDRVTINGKPSKPSKEVSAGDKIGIRFGDKTVHFEVLAVPSGNVGKDDADSLYRIIEGE
ncbi:MAG: RNA-binding S4 domain-containing protein [Clostridiales bacterium]|jgi:ribosomal 50S subunit-recycling heat shock protein|nr:RNA-binding S4 domain-containing protein [Clostridiales bacterium]HOB64999.1 RNA-binding S4 domain-containing protein [Clostridia bacterium]HOK81824.1 RNA-binding S4 domain-containing protein [Clostridia bacterium]HOL60855.1 RNA-binding S4 domain-containing protein [Clostridia bacterium]HPO53551.1 RNA-binding S4 domain-containing protein [Clostridia bacterium]